MITQPEVGAPWGAAGPGMGDSMTSEVAGRTQLPPSALAVALAPMVELWRRLIAAHVPDREGRCSECRWQTRSADRWPCAVYDLAVAAQRVATTRNGASR